MACGGS
ncbi:hypothetical protein ECTW09195_5861, partial [Escherichia coli TW09195]